MPDENPQGQEPAAETTTEQSNETTTAAEVDSKPTPEPSQEKSIAELLAYDPFEPKDEPGEDETARKPAPKEAAEEKKVPPEKTAEEQKPADEAGGLKTVLEQLLADRQREPEPAKPAEEKPDKAKPRFAVNVPEPILAGIRSDDPAENSAAVNGLVNGVLNASYQAVLEHIEKNVMPRITEVVQSSHSSRDSRQEFHDQFYGSFPELNKPELKPYIFMTAQMLVREKGRGFTGVTPEFQKEVAERVKSLFNVQPQAAPKAQEPPRKQFNSGTTTRSTSPSKSVSDDINEVLFG